MNRNIDKYIDDAEKFMKKAKKDHDDGGWGNVTSEPNKIMFQNAAIYHTNRALYKQNNAIIELLKDMNKKLEKY